VRNILIKRDNKVVKVLDVYKFLQDPSVINDFYLKNNDYIIVQPAAKTVFIKGEVGRTGKYELTKNEGLGDLIKFAGNLSSQAFVEKAYVIRVDTNHLVVKDLNLKAALEGKMVALKNGDTVMISQVNDAIRNFVEVSGAVQLAGRFQYIKGEKMSHLLERAQGLRYDAYLGRAYIIRSYQGGEKKYFQINLGKLQKDSNSTSNIVIEELDRIKVFSALDFYDQYNVEIRGAVRREGKLEFSENLTLQDVIFFFGGLKNEAANNRIEISRWVNYTDTKDNSSPIEVVVETYDVSDDLSFDKLKEVKLKPMDKIFVRYVEDYQAQAMVVLKGQVKYPGTYALLNDQETIKSVIERAGGFNEGAFLEGAKMTRYYEEIGELVVNFYDLYNKGKNQYDYVLRNGDTITIPKIDNIIPISGQVGSVLVAGRFIQNAPYTRGRRARYYIREYAGGFTKEASRSKVYVISSSGSVKKSRNFGLFKIYPRVKRGDKITVGSKKKKEEIETVPLDWNKTIEALTVKVTGVMTLYLLFKNVFK
jgi:protein involved in polysaccharide export with SLBB domain